MDERHSSLQPSWGTAFVACMQLPSGHTHAPQHPLLSYLRCGPQFQIHHTICVEVSAHLPSNACDGVMVRGGAVDDVKQRKAVGQGPVCCRVSQLVS